MFGTFSDDSFAIAAYLTKRKGPFARAFSLSLPPKECDDYWKMTLFLLRGSFLRRLLRCGFLRCHSDLLVIQLVDGGARVLRERSFLRFYKPFLPPS